MNVHLRSPREILMHTLLAWIAVVPQGAVLAAVRTAAEHTAVAAGSPITLRERALHAALCWVANAADGTRLAEIRTFAGEALLALDSNVRRLEYWTEYMERRVANGTAGRVLA